ncbi:fungal-specific actin related protein [Pluteus cervinus]|uniref:Fungal-specific actin related protein n=1 Tax=Pluteus cervinus TaxID=181527 RepID=A0ACD3AB83_9AGAR|nr:fungal-specific actin related protein [Pluteus cervinus]
MSSLGQPTTPKAKSAISPTTPAGQRVTAHTAVVQASPHYVTTRRHSLYGVEDRVIIDPGSRIWKVGFSGEGRPRDVFYACKDGGSLWELRRATDPAERAEEDRLLELRLQTCLRSVFHDSLLTDPKARKVILVEHPLLPLYIKDMIARILFQNAVPSVSFASSHLLSLLAVGKITGLVLDVGHLESVALPIFAARPLFPQLRATPLAGARLTLHLRALLLMFGTYLPPPTSLSAAANIPAANRSTRVPQEVLTDAVIEDIKTRCCFVGEALSSSTGGTSNDNTRGSTPGAGDELSDVDQPPPSDATQSESDFSQTGFESTSNVSSQRETSSEFSIISNPRVPIAAHSAAGESSNLESHLKALASMYTRHSTATDLQLKVIPPVSQQTGTGRGTLLIPGWIRERAGEVLFEGGDVDEASIVEVILEALLKVPMDLRKTLASSILVIGGTAMLPGFIPRLHAELLRAISTPPSAPSPSTSPNRKPPPPPYDRYASLRSLVPYFAIMNNPSPGPAKTARAAATSGKAPAFVPSLMPWVGGSLAGVLKTGGTEISREKWDEANPQTNDGENEDSDEGKPVTPRSILPDWTRIPLPSGAPQVEKKGMEVDVQMQGVVGA